MKKRVLTIFIFAILATVLISSFTSAFITGTLGGSRQVLTLPVNQTHHGQFTIINRNDFPVHVSLTESGDLVNYLTLSQTEINLQPDEIHPINFTIRSPTPGATVTNIQAIFSYEDESVGLTGRIIVIAFPSNITEGGEDEEETECDRECQKMCKDDYKLDIKSCNINYSADNKICKINFAAQKANCQSLESSQINNCVRNSIEQNKICKRESIDNKALCRLAAREELNLCLN